VSSGRVGQGPPLGVSIVPTSRNHLATSVRPPPLRCHPRVGLLRYRLKPDLPQTAARHRGYHPVSHPPCQVEWRAVPSFGSLRSQIRRTRQLHVACAHPVARFWGKSALQVRSLALLAHPTRGDEFVPALPERLGSGPVSFGICCKQVGCIRLRCLAIRE
jgi:hypothetical protein